MFWTENVVKRIIPDTDVPEDIKLKLNKLNKRIDISEEVFAELKLSDFDENLETVNRNNYGKSNSEITIKYSSHKDEITEKTIELPNYISNWFGLINQISNENSNE